MMGSISTIPRTKKNLL